MIANATKLRICCVHIQQIAILLANIGNQYKYTYILFDCCIYTSSGLWLRGVYAPSPWAVVVCGSQCRVYTPPHPTLQGVAEKGVGSEGQPIGLYTSPHTVITVKMIYTPSHLRKYIYPYPFPYPFPYLGYAWVSLGLSLGFGAKCVCQPTWNHFGSKMEPKWFQNGSTVQIR